MPLPLILGGIMLITGGIYACLPSKTCLNCGKKIHRSEQGECYICGKGICIHCSKQIYICDDCERLKKKNIEMYPITYKGVKDNSLDTITVAGNKYFKGELVCSQYYKKKSDALEELKLKAIYNNYDIVYGYKFEKEENRYDNYIYSVWKVSGYGAKNVIG